MLHDIKELYRHQLAARDGTIGHVKDFYFEDEHWVVRYLVADTGSWLAGRQVLLSPHAFGTWDHAARRLLVDLTRQQIEGSPSIDTHMPVSRRYEVAYHRYYGWPGYWAGGDLWGMGGYPLTIPPWDDEMETVMKDRPTQDQHLRSVRALIRYEILDGKEAVGSVHSFMVDDTNWALPELVVETGHWFERRRIRISTRRVQRVSHDAHAIIVGVTRAEIERTAEGDLIPQGDEKKPATAAAE